MINKIFTGFSSSSSYTNSEQAIISAEQSCIKQAYEFIEKKNKGNLFFSKPIDLVIWQQETVKAFSRIRSCSKYEAQASIAFTFCTREYKENIDKSDDDKKQQERFLSLIEEYGYDKMNELLDKFYKLNARPMD